MNEINKIIKDESHNDKELVKELSIYVKNHRDKNLPIDGKFIKDVANIIFKNSEIDFNYILFTNDPRIAWNQQEKCPEFNILRFRERSKYKKDVWFKAKKVGNARIFEYHEYLELIIHELTHGRQYYLVEKEKNEIYDSFYRFLEENYKTYCDYHDNTLGERYANLRASVLAYQVLSYIYPYECTHMFRKAILWYLIYGYHVMYNGEFIPANTICDFYSNTQLISAVDFYNILLKEVGINQINIEVNENMTLYDRLYLGLPITPLEYVKISNLYNELASKRGDVKTLVNRLK